MMKSAILFSVFFACTLAKSVYFCDVPIEVEAGYKSPKITLKGQSYGWENFNAISFQDFNSGSGDVEGRAAVKGGVSVSHYSFGYELQTMGNGALDNHLPYSLVVGGKVNFDEGALYPDGTGFPYAGLKETGYAGGSVTGSKDLVDSIEGNSGSLDDAFNAAETHFNLLSTKLASKQATGSATVQYSGITLDCAAAGNAETIYFSVTSNQMNDVTYWTVNPNCNANSAFVFNIMALGDLHFRGDNIYHDQERVVYNIIGGGYMVYIHTEVRGNILAPGSFYSQKGEGVVKGLVVARSMLSVHQINRVACHPHPEPEEPMPCVGFESECSGLINTAFNFRDMNVVAFGDFTAKTGDVEGRVAVQGTCKFGDGWSIGAVLSTINDSPDRHADYSLVCGEDATWGSGELYPLGTGYLALGELENMLIGGTFTSTQDHFQSRLDNKYGLTSSDISSFFTEGKKCYNQYQQEMSSRADNTQHSIEWSGLYITCNDASTELNIITLTPEELTSFTYINHGNCNMQGRWIINVVGAGDVDITGDSFPAVRGSVVYNVIGSGRTINVHDTALNGHILAPDNDLNQVSGVIFGKVVVRNIIHVNQVNRETQCQEVTSIEVKSACAEASNGNTARVEGFAALRVEDDAGVLGKITAKEGDEVTFENAVSCSAGQSLPTIVLKSNAGRHEYPNRVQANSASSTVIAVAAIAVAALLI